MSEVAATTPGTRLLEAVDVGRTYRTKAGALQAVRGVSLTLGGGEALALVGESGSGKSTLARLLICLERPTTGSIAYHGLDVVEDRRQAEPWVRRHVSMVFQNPYGSLNPRISIGRSVREPLKVHRWRTATEQTARVQEVLQAVGLDPHLAARRPRALSGGQRQRIAIARSLALTPELVILDEPVSALDVSVQAQILNLLADLREQFNLAYLFISHDLAVVRHVAEHTAVMFLGRIVESGATDDLFDAPQHPYTIALLSSAVEDDPDTHRVVLQGEAPSPLNPPSGCPFRTRCFRAQSVCVEIDPPLAGTGDRQVRCHFPGPLGTHPQDVSSTRSDVLTSDP
jgi:oligopeptide/dipeptide ABC transporter ATP-binding protein